MVDIIGLSGVAGVGKDYIANILCEDFGFIKVAFADPIKRICRDVFDFSEEQLWGPSEKRNEPDKRYLRSTINAGHMLTEEALKEFPDGMVPQYLTPRYSLQKLGTEWGRECYENVWVDYTLRVAQKISTGQYLYDSQLGLRSATWLEHPDGLLKVKKNVVIPDVRFRNELDALHKVDAKVIRIRRSRGTTLDAEAAQHASERDQADIPDSDFDFVLNNVEEPLALQVSIIEMMKVLGS